MDPDNLEAKFRGMLNNGIMQNKPAKESHEEHVPSTSSQTSNNTTSIKKVNWDIRWTVVISCIITALLIKIPNKWWDSLSWSKLFGDSKHERNRKVRLSKKKAIKQQTQIESDEDSDIEIQQEFSVENGTENLTQEEIDDPNFQPLQSD